MASSRMNVSFRETVDREIREESKETGVSISTITNEALSDHQKAYKMAKKGSRVFLVELPEGEDLKKFLENTLAAGGIPEQLSIRT